MLDAISLGNAMQGVSAYIEAEERGDIMEMNRRKAEVDQFMSVAGVAMQRQGLLQQQQQFGQRQALATKQLGLRKEVADIGMERTQQLIDITEEEFKERKKEFTVAGLERQLRELKAEKGIRAETPLRPGVPSPEEKRDIAERGAAIAKFGEEEVLAKEEVAPPAVTLRETEREEGITRAPLVTEMMGLDRDLAKQRLETGKIDVATYARRNALELDILDQNLTNLGMVAGLTTEQTNLIKQNVENLKTRNTGAKTENEVTQLKLNATQLEYDTGLQVRAAIEKETNKPYEQYLAEREIRAGAMVDLQAATQLLTLSGQIAGGMSKGSQGIPPEIGKILLDLAKEPLEQEAEAYENSMNILTEFAKVSDEFTLRIVKEESYQKALDAGTVTVASPELIDKPVRGARPKNTKLVFDFAVPTLSAEQARFNTLANQIIDDAISRMGIKTTRDTIIPGGGGVPTPKMMSFYEEFSGKLQGVKPGSPEAKALEAEIERRGLTRNPDVIRATKEWVQQ